MIFLKSVLFLNHKLWRIKWIHKIIYFNLCVKSYLSEQQTASSQDGEGINRQKF